MINSVNTLEFLKPKLITMDKFNSTTTTRILPSPTSLAPSSRTFVTFSHHTMDPQQQQQQQKLLAEEVQQQQQSRQERVKVQRLENHTKLQNNNCWNNFRTLYQLSASGGFGGGIRDKGELMHTIRETSRSNITPTPTAATAATDDELVDVEHFSTKPNAKNIQNKSAFNIDFITTTTTTTNNKNYDEYNNSIYGNINNKSSTETNNNNYNIVNNFYTKQLQQQQQQQHNGLKQSSAQTIQQQMFAMTAIPQRTEDQDHAYRHLESVHNYAKLKSYEDDDDYIESPNGSRHSSYLDDDDEDDEEDNDDDDEDDYENRLDPVNSAMADDLDADYEVLFNRRRLQKLSTSSDGALNSKLVGVGLTRNPLQFMNALKLQKIQTIEKSGNDDNDQDEDLHIDVDVETVDAQANVTSIANNPIVVNSLNIESSPVKPDHHARRPMNAFLIFCKRHRAIVKERYKNLENRAITKILGDWWASLDTNDKTCFTNLAQQNKDAFFSANPNFKWYKLPAPPLRTLTTRPANGPGQDYDDMDAIETISNNTRSSDISNSNYFKLADEAQMGDLSQLMQDKSKTSTKQCAALQQALGETSQFISAHITANAANLEEKQTLKRRFYNENSFSSNSSEEDALQPKKKSARSCKGKRYQELINSGQIATVVKKPSKSSLRLGGADNTDMEVKQNFTNLQNNQIICQKRSVSESEHLMSYDLSSFDLEEKIKELPALDLDDYLQRKRNTKKKKKFTTTGKKRGKCSTAGNKEKNNNSPNVITNQNNQMLANTLNREHMKLQHKSQLQQQQATAVGSQKRKARKESITRRDVSAIEQEVASLLPLTINGCCYFQEAPTPKSAPANTCVKSNQKDSQMFASATTNTITTTLNLTSPSIIPLQQQQQQQENLSLPASSSGIDILHNTTLNDNISSSTSDLLILAEVAANRTELKH